MFLGLATRFPLWVFLEKTDRVITETLCTIDVKSYNYVTLLGKHWCRWWRHQIITWANVAIPSMKPYGVNMSVISQKWTRYTHWNRFDNYTFEITATSSRGHRVNLMNAMDNQIRADYGGFNQQRHTCSITACSLSHFNDLRCITI